MSDLQVLAAAAAAALSIIAAIIAVVGAGRGGRADALASFAPFSLCLALAGALLAWLGFGPGSATAVLLGLNGVVAALCLARLAPELMRLRPALRRDRPALRILSGNLYWTNPSAGDAVATILARDADVVMLQEAGRRLAPALAGLDARYPHVAVCRHAGLRIYAKSPMVAHRCNCEQADTPRGRLLTATIMLSDSTVTLATTHFSHPYRGDLQARERNALAAAVNGLDRRRLVLVGDFNTTPWSYGMRRQDAMLAPLRRWTIAWFTWPARLPGWKLTWPLPLLPIDHLYAGPSWRQVRLRRVRLPGSDHFATEASLFRAQAEKKAE